MSPSSQRHTTSGRRGRRRTAAGTCLPSTPHVSTCAPRLTARPRQDPFHADDWFRWAPPADGPDPPSHNLDSRSGPSVAGPRRRRAAYETNREGPSLSVSPLALGLFFSFAVTHPAPGSSSLAPILPLPPTQRSESRERVPPPGFSRGPRNKPCSSHRLRLRDPLSLGVLSRRLGGQSVLGSSSLRSSALVRLCCLVRCLWSGGELPGEAGSV